jgi:hypothetical protein
MLSSMQRPPGECATHLSLRNSAKVSAKWLGSQPETFICRKPELSNSGLNRTLEDWPELGSVVRASPVSSATRTKLPISLAFRWQGTRAATASDI